MKQLSVNYQTSQENSLTLALLLLIYFLYKLPNKPNRFLFTGIFTVCCIATNQAR